VAILKAKEIMCDIHTKTFKKFKDNPDQYVGVYPTQLEYWLKKGLKIKDARIKLKERQTTFSLDICVEKYGEIEGLNRWLDRQLKWSTNYKKSNFSKISQLLFWDIYNLLENKNDIYFATLKNGEKDDSGINNEKRIKLKSIVISSDFIDTSQNKIIEFDGVYYHRSTPENIKRDIHRDMMLLYDNYKILHINENEYKQNPENILKECIEFLNK